MHVLPTIGEGLDTGVLLQTLQKMNYKYIPAEPAEQMCTMLLLGTKMPLNRSLALE